MKTSSQRFYRLLTRNKPIIIAATWCICNTPAMAIDLVAVLTNSSEYTSNTLKSDKDEIGEWVHHPGIDLSARQDSNRWLVNAEYHYQKRLYQKDYWKDEPVTTGVGEIRWRPLPQRIDFFMNNVRTESSVRALQAETQENRQVLSTTQIGSTFNAHPLRRKDTLQFEYAYVDNDADDTRTDSSRNTGTLAYIIDSSESSAVQIRTSHSDITFDGPFPAARFTVATLGYTVEADDIDLDMKIGHNWYDRAGRGKYDDSTYDVSIVWQISSNSSVTLTAFDGIVDRSTNLDGSPDIASENTGTNAAFNETRGDLSFNQTLGRTTLTLGGNWARHEYAVDVPLDNNRVGFTFGVSRRLTRWTTINLDVDYSDREFIDQADNQEETVVRFSLDHQMGRSFDIGLGAVYHKRKSDRDENFDEWRTSLVLRYTFLGAG